MSPLKALAAHRLLRGDAAGSAPRGGRSCGARHGAGERAVLPPRGRQHAERLDDVDRDVCRADSLAPGAVRRRRFGRSAAANCCGPQQPADGVHHVRRRLRREHGSSRCRCCCDEQMPFTYFVSTNHVFGNRPFPHDVAAGAAARAEYVSPAARDGGCGRRDRRPHPQPRPSGQRSRTTRWSTKSSAAKHDLEQALEREVRYFAFPYGQPTDLSTAAFQIAYERVTTAFARPTAATTFPATIRFTCGGFTPTASWFA